MSDVLTTQRMRELADAGIAAGGYELNETPLVHTMAAALRAAADRLDAVEAYVATDPNGHIEYDDAGRTAGDIERILAAVPDDAVRAVRAAAWRGGFIASHNMEIGHALDFDHPVDKWLDQDIDAWNPHTGTGTTDPLEEDDE